MSTGSITLDILLDQILEDAISKSNNAIAAIKDRYPNLTEKEAMEIHKLIVAASQEKPSESASLVVTAPPFFGLKTKTTKIAVDSMMNKAQRNILITGYSLSDYVSDLLDCIIEKSQKGVYVKFFVNHIESQKSLERLCRYKGKFLKIYNYPEQEDAMAALHAKVISIDNRETLITSANLSYHGQNGNIELGAYIESETIAKQVDDIFTKLILKKIFKEI